MPTYEYKCLDCDRRSEAFQSMMDEPLATCGECGGKLKRLIGAGAGFLFKGNGFYATDYRSDSYKAAAKQDSSTASAASAPASDTKSGSDTKKSPTPKTESKSK
ncbi:MAG: zinc ribbon domain-containing protein [Victivallales bacterium]|nr:zinc ribbon domain-containing protein [Victivallales bacterium]MBT7166728.1 zinc ribbon domain-containing protein [Victivallales bacterium]